MEAVEPVAAELGLKQAFMGTVRMQQQWQSSLRIEFVVCLRVILKRAVKTGERYSKRSCRSKKAIIQVELINLLQVAR